jgi:hypothetical protein
MVERIVVYADDCKKKVGNDRDSTGKTSNVLLLII